MWEYFFCLIRNKGKGDFPREYSRISEEVTPWESFVVRGCIDTSLSFSQQ